MQLAATETMQKYTRTRSVGQHALVIGASIAGLLAARVLSDYFELVTIVERDPLSMNVQARKGVPQSGHVHLLMCRGADIMSQLFPDLFSALERDGALLISPTDDFRWFHFGAWKLQFPGPLRIHSQSRSLLEFHIRRCIACTPNIRILDNCQVFGLTHGHSCNINGVQLRRRNSSSQGAEWLAANLIVDASGRGSQASSWLTTLGYPPIEETFVNIGVGYATRIYRRPDRVPGNWKAMSIYPWPPGMKRTGYIFPIEGNAWMVTLSGCLHDHPPTDEAGFLAFAYDLARPDIYQAIKDAQPLSPIVLHKFPTSRRRHYERASHLPDGLITLGDAACCFNPIYGQGMTVAAREADMLRISLEQQLNMHTENMAGFAYRFHKAMTSVINTPWLFATCEDLRYPATEGKRSLCIRLLQAYTQRICRLTATDPFVTQSFYEVLNMLKPPTALFHPRVLFSALCSRTNAPS
ncbi:MAG: FAD-dependent oxidoreductase [Ktedonobacteraceae bacterium]|nr:FAD-dependent oxidoreductase [Ktedonobacteraceae bacterium]